MFPRKSKQYRIWKLVGFSFIIKVLCKLHISVSQQSCQTCSESIHKVACPLARTDILDRNGTTGGIGQTQNQVVDSKMSLVNDIIFVIQLLCNFNLEITPVFGGWSMSRVFQTTPGTPFSSEFLWEITIVTFQYGVINIYSIRVVRAFYSHRGEVPPR